MSRTTARIATIAALVIVAATPALAADPKPAAPAPTARQPADAAQRAQFERMDPLARSVFWTNEVQINPRDAVAGVKLSQALRELGRNDQAVEAAQRVLSAEPDNMDALLEIGRAHIARGQAFYGIASLERARALAPSDWRPLSLLGVAYKQVRRDDDASAAWAEGLRIAPDNATLLSNAAMALAADGNAAGAETLLRRAAAQPDASLQVRQNLALVLGLQGKTAEAEQMLRRDLPPELADSNLAWLRARTAPDEATPTPASTTARTWSSLQGG